MAGGDEDSDNDAEDIGQRPFEQTLNYDSDEKDNDGNKMISLEEMPKPKKQKNIPAIRKPQTK